MAGFNILDEDFVNGIYEDRYVRFYRGNHTIIKIPASSLLLVMAFDSSISLDAINCYYNAFINK